MFGDILFITTEWYSVCYYNKGVEAADVTKHATMKRRAPTANNNSSPIVKSVEVWEALI